MSSPRDEPKTQQTTGKLLSVFTDISINEDYSSQHTSTPTDELISSNIISVKEKEPRLLPLKTRKLTDFTFKPKQPAPSSTGYFNFSFMQYIPNVSGLFSQPSSGGTSRSFHKTEEVTKNGQQEANFIFKHNPEPGIFTTYHLMPKIEAAMSRASRFLGGRKNFVKSYAIYDDKNQTYAGVAVKKFPNFKEARLAPLKKSDLSNEELVEQIARNHFYELFLENDDEHPGNFGYSEDKKNEWHIDRDMLMWRVTRLFKGNTYLNSYRNPTETTFKMSPKSFAQFPKVEDQNAPSIWLTSPAQFISESKRKSLSQFLPVSTNAFSTDDNALYKELGSRPGARMGAGYALLKIILTNRQMFRNIMSLDLKESDKYNETDSKNVIDMFADEFESQITQYTQTALESVEFQEFLQKHGEKTLQKIIKEFEADNIHLKDKLDKHYKLEKELQHQIKKLEEKFKLDNNGKPPKEAKALVTKFEEENTKLQEQLKHQTARREEVEEEVKLLTIDLNLIQKNYNVFCEKVKNTEVKPLDDEIKTLLNELSENKKPEPSSKLERRLSK